MIPETLDELLRLVEEEWVEVAALLGRLTPDAFADIEAFLMALQGARETLEEAIDCEPTTT